MQMIGFSFLTLDTQEFGYIAERLKQNISKIYKAKVSLWNTNQYQEYGFALYL